MDKRGQKRDNREEWDRKRVPKTDEQVEWDDGHFYVREGIRRNKCVMIGHRVIKDIGGIKRHYEEG